MVTFQKFSNNLKQVQDRIQSACAACGRSFSEVSLLPVTKNHPATAVDYVHQAGLTAVGENRLQEAVDKMAQTSATVKWELIGHLQSNKAKLAVEHFDRIQSVDSIKLAERLDRLAAEQGRVVPILLQVNAGDDPAKFGIACKDAPQVLETVLQYSYLKVDGLMTIAPLDEDLSVAAKAFNRLRELCDQLKSQFNVQLPELSMGMTDDMEEAIKAGSTMIRVGTALFGARE